MAEDNGYSAAIRKITPTGMVSTVVGIGTTSIGTIRAIAVDKAGNLFVPDPDSHLIRKIAPGGSVSVFAGIDHGLSGEPGSADGTGTTARFSFPEGIATDREGNVFVADKGNSTIRKITPAGVVSTLAGTPGVIGFADGQGAAAKFMSPLGLTTDDTGNVYVADWNNSVIRKITPTGAVTTVVGVPRQFGFAEGPAPGVLTHPVGVTVSGSTLYVLMQNGVVAVRSALP